MIDDIHIASYPDDITPYSVGKKQCDLETKLQRNHLNQDKCHCLLSFEIKHLQ